MSSDARKLQKTIEQLYKEDKGKKSKSSVLIPTHSVEFARALFKFEAKPYQAELLEDKSKRIVVRWSRQAGKTTCIALRAIWFAVTHPKTLTLIVAPSLRQSMIMSDRIGDFLTGLPRPTRLQLVEKLQRTTVRFKKGSRIVALPNSL